MTEHKYGPNGHIVDAFIEHLEGMTETDWDKVIAAWYAAGDAAWDAGSAARDATWSAVWEIQGADLVRERGQKFFFLPMFGFADEHAVLAALQPEEKTK